MAVSTVRTQALRTILFFGALIGAVLLAVQAAALRGFVAGDPGWTTGVTGLAFLVAGILVGARLHRTRFDRVGGRVQAVERARDLRLLE